MSLRTKKKSGPSAPPMEAGTYPAVCVGVVDLGEQYDSFNKKYAEKILLTWEIPSQRVQADGEDKPRWLSRDFTNSLHEKSALHKLLVSWRGKPFTDAELTPDADGFTQFSVLDMLGEPCLLQVIVEEKEDGTKRNKITSVIGLPAGMDAPKPENPLFAFDMDNWDDEVFSSLLGWVQERIKKSTQYQKLHAPVTTVDFPGETPSQPAADSPLFKGAEGHNPHPPLQVGVPLPKGPLGTDKEVNPI